MLNEVITHEPWYDSLIEDCKDISVEMGFTSRWALVEGYHLLGERIIQDEIRLTQGGSNLRQKIASIAKYISKRERSLYYAVEFVRKFPNLDAAPFDKTVNWYRIVHEHLTTESDRPKQLTKQDLSAIIYKIKELLKTEYQKAKQNELNNTLPEYPNISSFIFYLQDQVEKYEL